MLIALYICLLMATNGVIAPYQAGYYESLGFSGKEIAFLVSIGPFGNIFVPLAWGFVADRTGRIAPLLRIASVGALICYFPLFFYTGYWSIVATLVAYTLFVTTCSPLADTIAVAEARRLGTEYSRLRLIGSLGFIVVVQVLGYHLAKYQTPWDVVPAALMCIASFALLSVFVFDAEGARPGKPPTIRDVRKLVNDPSFFFFLLYGLLHWGGNQSYYMFFNIHLAKLGYGSDYTGWGFSLGVTAEVIMMWYFPLLRRKYNLYLLLCVSTVLTVLRWALTSYLTNGLLLVLVQSLHAFTFASFIVSSIAHLEVAVPQEMRATGRALFAAAVMGFGGIIGSQISGRVYDWGGTERTFQVSAMMECLGPLALGVSWLTARRRTQAQVAALAQNQPLPTQILRDEAQAFSQE